MRCSKCLSHMTAEGGVYVCTGCGARAGFLNEDGSRAVFEDAGPPRRLHAGVIALVLIVLAGTGAAAFASLHFDLLARFRPAPVAAEAAPPLPEMRTGLAATFDPGLRAGLIAGFGTLADDDLRGLALFGDARIGALLLSGGEAPALHFVSVDGTQALAARRIALSGVLSAAALVAGPEDLALVLAGDEDGLRLSALGPGGENLWDQDWGGRSVQDGQFALAADRQNLLVLVPGETPGTNIAAMLDAGGALVWQRTFPAAAAPGAAAALDEVGVWLAFPAAEASGLRLMRLSRAGETLLDREVDLDPGEMAGLQAGPDGSARLFAAGPLPQVRAIGPSGETLWQSDVRSALLHDRTLLLSGEAGQSVIVSAYRLSDVQTDLAVTRLSAGGEIVSDQTVRLPPGTRLAGAGAIGTRRLLVAGSAAETAGGPRDAFLLAVELAEAAGEATEARRAAPRPEAMTPAPDASVAAPVAEAQPQAAPPSVACAFACLSGAEALTVTQQVFADDAGEVAGLKGLQAVICQARGAAPDPGAEPACEAPP